MEKFFALFGKLVLVAALLGAVAFGAYTFGKTTQKPGTAPGAGRLDTQSRNHK